ncbi:inter-alpha-trypsin inhibitor heavy chain H4-like isoform X2 [Ischnura elegans]|uniref:inter-alpha-trypsin inhibitor heavy chain H4-like isoform X2 n=1 Tax=Ischnura elegans TaxID=197161 RepID=UPI001ED8996B|nr:inter-alpha-trypsin inhibitor heavy chain H4-like isoform X2 [Ischnura elegans]
MTANERPAAGGVLGRLRGFVAASLVLMTVPGVMTFATQGGAPQAPETILRSYSIHSSVHYRYATTLVSSQVENPTDRKQRVNFTVILPENAYITSFVMDVGDQSYETTVTERTPLNVDGKRDEIEAIRARDSNIFRASVCLEPGGTTASFYLTYEELLKRKMGVYQHILNLHPGQVAQEMKVEVFIHEGRNITTLSVPAIRSGHEIYPPNGSEPLIQMTQPKPTEALIRLMPSPEEQEKWRGQWKRTKIQRAKMAQRGEAQFMERGIEGQLVVLYDVDRDPYYSRNSGGEVVVQGGYFVHFFAPDNLPTFNRHLVLVIDRSESMKGRKWKLLKKGLEDILDNLKRTEYFSIIKFNDKKSVWSPFPKEERAYQVGEGRVVPASSKYLEMAKKHIKKLTPAGGTKTLRGILKGLSVARESYKLGGSSPLFPMVVLVTDGENNTDIPGMLSDDENSKGLDGHWEIPIYCMGYEPDADIPFLRAISRRSAGGVTRRIYDATDADIQLGELFAESASPQLGGIRFTYTDHVGDLEVDPETLTYTRFYTAVSGSEIVVAGKLKGHFESGLDAKYDPNLEMENVDGAESGPSLNGYVTATSARGRGKFLFSSTVSDSSFQLERLWAYLMVSQLTSQESAQKVWGTYWTEKSLNGLNISSIKPQEHEPYYPDFATNISYLVSSSKFVSKHYSFVSPGMILKFAEMKDYPWDYSSQNVMDYDLGEDHHGRRRSKRAHPRRTRPQHKGSGGRVAAAAGHGLGRIRYHDYDRDGQCSDMQQGMYWLALPEVPKPSSLCQIDISRVSCLDGLPDGDHPRDKYPMVKSLAELTWMKDVKRGATLILPKGYRGAQSSFKLGLGQEDKQFAKCKTPAGVPGHCRHLNYCLLKDFAADYNHFLKFFCHIEGSPSYVGVCCPDYLYRNRMHHG